MLPPGLQRRVERIAAAERTTVRALTLAALRELVKAYPGPATRARAPRPTRVQVAVRRARASLAKVTKPAPQASAPKLSPMLSDHCTRCDHRAVEHEDKTGRCWIVGCVCREFYA